MGWVLQKMGYFLLITDKKAFEEEYFSCFSKEAYVIGTNKKCLTETLLMSTHNMFLYREIRKLPKFIHLKKQKKNKESQHYLELCV